MVHAVESAVDEAHHCVYLQELSAILMHPLFPARRRSSSSCFAHLYCFWPLVRRLRQLLRRVHLNVLLMLRLVAKVRLVALTLAITVDRVRLRLARSPRPRRPYLCLAVPTHTSC